MTQVRQNLADAPDMLLTLLQNVRPFLQNRLRVQVLFRFAQGPDLSDCPVVMLLNRAHRLLHPAVGEARRHIRGRKGGRATAIAVASLTLVTAAAPGASLARLIKQIEIRAWLRGAA